MIIGTLPLFNGLENMICISRLYGNKRFRLEFRGSSCDVLVFSCKNKVKSRESFVMNIVQLDSKNYLVNLIILVSLWTGCFGMELFSFWSENTHFCFSGTDIQKEYEPYITFPFPGLTEPNILVNIPWVCSYFIHLFIQGIKF